MSRQQGSRRRPAFILEGRRIIALVLVGVALIGAGGCAFGTQGIRPMPTAAPAVVFITSLRANSTPVTAGPAINHWISNAVDEQATVTVVTTDGQPQVVKTVRVLNSGSNTFTRNQQHVANQATVMRMVTQARATTGEANILQALDIAGRAARAGSGTGSIVMIDSGLQTVAPLRFQDGLLSARTSPAQMAAFLRAENALPDLSGVSLTWLGLGQTAAPQQPLNIAARRQLQRIWQAVLAATGAHTTFSDAPLLSGRAHTALPAVTRVSVPPEGSLPPLRAVLDSRSVNFVADRAVLRNPAQALTTLRVVARAILAGGYHHVHILGTTASPGTEPGRLALAAARAETVRDVLVDQLRVPAADIVYVRGVGTHFAGYIPDTRPDGSLDEARAQLDRLVLISADN